MVRGSLVVLALLVGVAHANMGAPWSGGRPAGEPVGITGIAITREELVIDLRPLADGGPIAVSATYHLDNQGAEQHLDLVFAAGSVMSAFRITLDGKAVATAGPLDVSLPESWKPPASVPLVDGTTMSYELRERAMPIGFKLTVPPGRHDLAIAYDSEAVLYHAGDPTVLYQFGYVLSPARTWASFGGLDLTIHVPEGWSAAVTPEVVRDGDTLRGTYSSVPADAIALTIQAPEGLYGVVGFVSRVVFALVAFGGGFGVAMWARSRERRRRDAGQLSVSFANLGRGCAWAAVFFATGMFAIFGPNLALPAGHADTRGYGDGIAAVGVVLGSLLVLVIGTIVSKVVAVRVYRGNPVGDSGVTPG